MIVITIIVILTGIALALIPICLKEEDLEQIIAGYNSLPIEKKSEYDKKRLYKRFRLISAIIGFETSLFTILVTTLFVEFLLVSILTSCFIIIVTTFIGYIYMNKSKI